MNNDMTTQEEKQQLIQDLQEAVELAKEIDRQVNVIIDIVETNRRENNN